MLVSEEALGELDDAFIDADDTGDQSDLDEADFYDDTSDTAMDDVVSDIADEEIPASPNL
jgi:hypothetical protein